MKGILRLVRNFLNGMRDIPGWWDMGADCGYSDRYFGVLRCGECDACRWEP